MTKVGLIALDGKIKGKMLCVSICVCVFVFVCLSDLKGFK